MPLFTRSGPAELPTSNTEAGPRPPAWYPRYPTGDGWAPEGSDYYVPDEVDAVDRGERFHLVGLREAFASGRHEPSSGLIAGFQSGGSWSLPFSTEGKRPTMVIDHRDGQPLTSPPQSPDRDFARWMFDHTWPQVVKAKMAEIRTERMNATEPCRACGRPTRIFSGGASRFVSGYGHVSGCSNCVETLAFLVSAELVAAEERLPELQDHARELVRAKLGLPELEPSESA